MEHADLAGSAVYARVTKYTGAALTQHVVETPGAHSTQEPFDVWSCIHRHTSHWSACTKKLASADWERTSLAPTVPYVPFKQPSNKRQP